MARNGAGTERFTAVDSACGPQCTLPVRWTGGRRGVALGAALALPRKFPRQRRVDHMALLDLVSAQEGLFFGGWIRGPARKAFTLSEDERLRAANHMAVFAAFIDEKDERGGRSSLKRINRGRRKGYLLRCKQALRSGTLSRWAGAVPKSAGGPVTRDLCQERPSACFGSPTTADVALPQPMGEL